VNEFEETLISYLSRSDELRIIRVLHGKRDIDRILKKELG
jgi:plasmid stabilization system protein ParE